jgi:4-amino-4-deoxy-L-arabinose transferase-like glycosyltransferase
MTRRYDILYYVILIAIIFPVVFLKLGSFSIRWADEAMYAVNVYEMLEKKSFITPYFNHVADICNSKPPLVLCLQMGFVKVFGYNETALRLPSALASTGMILLVFGFLKRNFSVFAGFIGALILVTAQGMNTFHTGRTADPDAVTTFFITAANIVLLNTVIDRKVSAVRVLLFFILLALAFWAKSTMAFLFLPAIFLILVTDKELLIKCIKSKAFWLGLLFFIAASLSYIFLRNHYQPGYLQHFISYDVARVVNVIENHKEPFMFYIWNFNAYRFTYWFMPLLISVVCFIIMIARNGLRKERLPFALSVMVISFLLIISFSNTKLAWYDLPLYPMMAIIISIVVWYVIKLLNLPPKIKWIGLIVFIIPYMDVFGLNQTNSFSDYENINESKERYIYSLVLNKQSLDAYVAYQEDYDGALLFYKYRQKELGQNFRIEKNGVFSAGEKVIVSQPELKKKLESKYSYEIIDHNENVTVYRVIGLLSD